MDRPPIVVTSICIAAFVAAVFAVSLVSASASHDGKSELSKSAQELLEVLRGDRPDLARVQRLNTARLQPLLAAGRSLDDPRVRDVLFELARVVSDAAVVASARVTAGGRLGETDVLVGPEGRRTSFSRRPERLTLHWVRDASGRWGYDPLAR